MGKIAKWLSTLLGTTAGLAMMAFGFLSFPFSVVAMMRWFDFSVWGALIASMVVPAIPILGWMEKKFGVRDMNKLIADFVA
jgi:hypothetical protein